MAGTERRTRYLPDTSTPVLLFLLLWIVFSSAPPLFLTGGIVRIDFLSEDMIHRIVLAVQLSYLVVALPLLLSRPDVLEVASETGEGTLDWHRFWRYQLFTIVLLLLGYPAFMLAGQMAGASVQDLLSSQLQLFSLVFGVGLVWWGAGRKRRFWCSAMFVGLLVMTVMAPLLYAGLAQVGGAEYPFLLHVSPVVSVFRQERVLGIRPQRFQILLTMVSGVLIFAVLRLFREQFPSPPNERA